MDKLGDLVLNVKLLRPDARLPVRATPGSAGADLAPCEGCVLAPGQRVRLPLGFAAEVPAGYVGLVFIRSSLGMQGLVMANGVGVVDSDYRGEWLLALANDSSQPIEILPGQRVSQLVLVPAPALPVVQVEALSSTARGEGGFGSTGTGPIKPE